ncbi:hypothetical protein C8R46DRAFT_1319881 [Mycena filopes]|nr:hypothetical protein C8R46DRAFT_1319881 [Mycena filopes]
MRFVSTLIAAAAAAHTVVALMIVNPPTLPDTVEVRNAGGANPAACQRASEAIGTYDNTANFSPACADVTNACLKEDGTSIWSHAACVAAATCQGTANVIFLNQCQNPNVLEAGAIPNLSAAIYGAIVGSCAATGCPITQQNYTDFIYGSMAAANVTQWPNVNDVILQWWTPIVQWAATGSSIPYANFNDWLHFSRS